MMDSAASALRISRTSQLLHIGPPVPLPLLYHVLTGHPVRGHRASGTHYSPPVSCHYSNPIWVLRELRDREPLGF
jgi:hypothetical protein